jgi:uroporphyrinogen-III synthase
MTTRSNYTSQEWELLQKPLLSVGPTVAEAVDSGAIGTVLEYGAILDAALTARKQYASNILLQALLVDAQNQGLGKQPAHRKVQSAIDFMHLKAELLTACGEAVELLKHTASKQEVVEYRLVVLNIGAQVANAAREGGAGAVGSKINEAEEALLREISEALGIAEEQHPLEEA